MAEINIDLNLNIKIPDTGIKINNLLYQLKKFMVRIYFAMLKAIFSAVEEKAIAKIKEASSKRYVLNGRQKNHRQIRTPYGLF